MRSKNFDLKAQCLLLVGPLFIALILLAMALKHEPTPLVIPLTALAGLVLTTFWKWRGVAFSFLAIIAAAGLTLSAIPTHHWTWIIALSLAFTATLVVTVLCADEAYGQLEALSKESGDSLHTIARLNGRLQEMEKQLAADTVEWETQRQQLNSELETKDNKIRSDEHLIKLVRDEMSATYSQQEKLVQELYQARQQIARLEAPGARPGAVPLNEFQAAQQRINALEIRLKETEEQKQRNELSLRKLEEEGRRLAQGLADSEASGIQLKDRLTQSEAEALRHRNAFKEMKEQESILQADIAVAQKKEQMLIAELEQSMGVQQKADALAAELDQLQITLREVEAAKSILEKECAASRNQSGMLEAQQQELAVAKNALEARSEELARIRASLEDSEAKRKVLDIDLDALRQQLAEANAAAEVAVENDEEVKELRKIAAMFQQLRVQFNEKNSVLAATRRELFAVQERLLALQKDHDEALLMKENETAAAYQLGLSEALGEVHEEHKMQHVEIQGLCDFIDSLVTKDTPR